MYASAMPITLPKHAACWLSDATLYDSAVDRYFSPLRAAALRIVMLILKHSLFICCRMHVQGLRLRLAAPQ